MRRTAAGCLVIVGSLSRALVASMLLLLISGICVVRSVAAATSPDAKADLVVVLKSARQLVLMHSGRVLKTYPIALGASPRGPKRAQGDHKTPEGSYVIDGRHPHSPYHLALHISYPNAADRARAAAAHRDPGGDIFIHGLPSWFGPIDLGRFTKDWTEGCIAVGNKAIEEIWTEVADGTVIEIRP